MGIFVHVLLLEWVIDGKVVFGQVDFVQGNGYVKFFECIGDAGLFDFINRFVPLLPYACHP